MIDDDFYKLGYRKYDEEKPEKKILAECTNDLGNRSWTASLGPTGGGGPDGGYGGFPFWWRPALSKDELWREIVRLGE